MKKESDDTMAISKLEDDSNVDLESDSLGAESSCDLEDFQTTIGYQETRRVHQSKIFVYLALVFAAVAVSTVTYMFLSKEQENNMQVEFNAYSREILKQATANSENMFEEIWDLSKSITSHALYANLTWPNITLPHFDIRALDEKSRVEFVGFAPFVTPDCREGWEQYSVENQGWLSEEYERRGMDEAPHPIPPAIHRFDPKGRDPWFDFAGRKRALETYNYSDPKTFEYEIPLWQVAPAPKNTSIVNLDLASHPVFAHLLWDVRVKKVDQYSRAIDVGFLLGEDDTVSDGHPRGTIYQPVFKDFHKDAEVVGFMLGILSWDNMFENVLSEDFAPILVEIEGNCSSGFSYMLTGGEIVFVGAGTGFHEPRFDKYMQRVDLLAPKNSREGYPPVLHKHRVTDAAHNESHCTYVMTTYPTEEFEEHYQTIRPIFFTMAIASVFVCTVLVFVVYDFLVEIRQRHLMSTAERSTKIVSSLFPRKGRKRIMRNAEEQAAATDNLLRGLETLRHLPVVVRQFDLEGNLMDQNPEAFKLFGRGDAKQPPKEDGESTDNNVCEFVRCFEDSELGQRVLEQVATVGNDSQLEAKQRTIDTPDEVNLCSSGRSTSYRTLNQHESSSRWFSIKVRRVRDPVTSKYLIIYSARDISIIMQKAKEEADRINRSKQEFFAVMAHEIRTPLHQVVGFIELLAKTSLNAEQNEFCGMLQSSTHALMAIINDLLDFTKLEAGKITLEEIPFEARAVIDGCVAAVAPQAEPKQVHIMTNLERSIPYKLIGDPNRLRQVVLNILSNAVKFTPPGGKIEIQASSRLLQPHDVNLIQKEGSSINDIVVLRIQVQDTGIGISDEHLSRIFNPYQQADASVSRNYGGTGLGLAICESLVQNMGGEIGVTSELGKGTNFWFEIPLEKHSKTTTSNMNTTTALFEITPTITSSEQSPTLPTDQKEKEGDVSGFRILVAEDNKVNQKLAAAMLRRLGHTPTIVENGQLAVDEIESHDDQHYYDLVLMDIQMPVLDGIDATKEIRSRGYLESELPVVALTASIQSVDWNQCGMNDYIKKPVRIVDLKQALAKHARPRKKESFVDELEIMEEGSLSGRSNPLRRLAQSLKQETQTRQGEVQGLLADQAGMDGSTEDSYTDFVWC